MRIKNSFIIIICLSVAAIAVFGQQQSNQSSMIKPGEMVQKPAGFLNQLIDPNKFSMSQSYSLSFLSDGRQSANVGLYLNTMNYQFSDPLRMQVRVGYMHQPLGGATLQNNQNGSVFLQRAMLQYKPFENLTFTLDYQQLPHAPMSPYYWKR